jgi:hypothetical protein
MDIVVAPLLGRSPARSLFEVTGIAAAALGYDRAGAAALLRFDGGAASFVRGALRSTNRPARSTKAGPHPLRRR